jgi:thioredoxin-dependent peroxiredoxin
MLNPGDRLPDIEIQLARGGTRKLHDFTGRWLVLYFYPKDNTPGCTAESQDFNALLGAFRDSGAEILGVSRDSVRSHENFCAKYGFGFDLVADTDETLCRAFGVIKEKSMYGRKVMGIERSTFLIDPDGVIRQAWRPVKVKEHAASVLASLQQHART